MPTRSDAVYSIDEPACRTSDNRRFVEGKRVGTNSVNSAGKALDTTVAHPARRYNYWLGGKDHFAADRASGDLIAREYPFIVVAARENRAFLRRAVQMLAAEAEVRQFLDIGTGLPVPDNTHEVAQRLDPSSRVAYVDNDPMVMAHARALLTSAPEGRTCYIEDDLRNTARLLAHPELRGTLDFDRPIALLLVAVLHFLPDHDETCSVVHRLVAAMPPGSYLVASVATPDLMDPALAARLENMTREGKSDIHGRTREQFAQYFAGLSLVDPGIVPVSQWRSALRPPGEPTPPPHEASIYAAVGRKD